MVERKARLQASACSTAALHASRHTPALALVSLCGRADRCSPPAAPPPFLVLSALPAPAPPPPHLEPGPRHGDVVGGALALGLDQNQSVLGGGRAGGGRGWWQGGNRGKHAAGQAGECARHRRCVVQHSPPSHPPPPPPLTSRSFPSHALKGVSSCRRWLSGLTLTSTVEPAGAWQQQGGQGSSRVNRAGTEAALACQAHTAVGKHAAAYFVEVLMHPHPPTRPCCWRQTKPPPPPAGPPTPPHPTW